MKELSIEEKDQLLNHIRKLEQTIARAVAGGEKPSKNTSEVYSMIETVARSLEFQTEGNWRRAFMTRHLGLDQAAREKLIPPDYAIRIKDLYASVNNNRATKQALQDVIARAGLSDPYPQEPGVAGKPRPRPGDFQHILNANEGPGPGRTFGKTSASRSADPEPGHGVVRGPSADQQAVTQTLASPGPGPSTIARREESSQLSVFSSQRNQQSPTGGVDWLNREAPSQSCRPTLPGFQEFLVLSGNPPEPGPASIQAPTSQHPSIYGAVPSTSNRATLAGGQLQQLLQAGPPRSAVPSDPRPYTATTEPSSRPQTAAEMARQQALAGTYTAFSSADRGNSHRR